MLSGRGWPIIDCLIGWVILMGSSALWDVQWGNRYWTLTFLYFFSVFGKFWIDSGRKNVRESLFQSEKDVVKDVLRLWAWVGFSLLGIGYITKTTALYSRLVVSSWVVFTVLTQIGVRYATVWYYRRLRKKGVGVKRVALIGEGELYRSARGFLKEKGIAYGFKLEREFSIQKLNDDTLSSGIADEEFDAVWVAANGQWRERIKKILETLGDSTVAMYIIPDVISISLLKGTPLCLDNLTIVCLFDSPCRDVVNYKLKRIEDIIVSLFALILTTVPMLIIAIIIKLTSPGPVIFKQRRYGMNGKEITVWKFRTMKVCEDGDKIRQACRDDERVTPFGRFLRRFSLDELPQFINVLQGRMSVVGPRPHAVAHNEMYRNLIKGYMLRHFVLPGITGWAQVNGFRGETNTLELMKKRVEYDLWYIQNWSLWLDIKIILLTAFKIFYDKKAY